MWFFFCNTSVCHVFPIVKHLHPAESKCLFRIFWHLRVAKHKNRGTNGDIAFQRECPCRFMYYLYNELCIICFLRSPYPTTVTTTESYTGTNFTFHIISSMLNACFSSLTVYHQRFDSATFRKGR